MAAIRRTRTKQIRALLHPAADLSRRHTLNLHRRMLDRLPRHPVHNSPLGGDNLPCLLHSFDQLSDNRHCAGIKLRKLTVAC